MGSRFYVFCLNLFFSVLTKMNSNCHIVTPLSLSHPFHLSYSVAQQGDRCHNCRLTGSTKHGSRKVLDLLHCSMVFVWFCKPELVWVFVLFLLFLLFGLFGLGFRFIYVYFTCGCFACMHVYAPLACITLRGQKRASGPLKWSYRWLAVSQHVGAGNWSWVLCQSSESCVNTEPSLGLMVCSF